jgi:hypothetical protein
MNSASSRHYDPFRMSQQMLFTAGSPLLALPQGMDKQEAMYLDAMRFAMEMAELSYSRLCEVLIKLPGEEDEVRHRLLSTCAVQDAWSTIDSADRLRSLMGRAKSVDICTDLKSGFDERIDAIRGLRNTVQHLDQQIPSLAAKKWPVWGALRWFAWTEPPHVGVSCQLLAGGHVTKRPFTVEAPRSKEEPVGISEVILVSRGVEVSLRTLREDIALLARALEEVTAKRLADQSSDERLADLFMMVGVDFRLGEQA